MKIYGFETESRWENATPYDPSKLKMSCFGTGLAHFAKCTNQNVHNITKCICTHTHTTHLYFLRSENNATGRIFRAKSTQKYMTWLDLRMRLFIHSFTFDSANEWKTFDKKKNTNHGNQLLEWAYEKCVLLCGVVHVVVPFEAITSNGPVWYGCVCLVFYFYSFTFWMCIEVDVTARH